jgi:hypothetical protein
LAANERNPFDRAFLLLNPLVARAALVLAGDDVLGAPRHVGDNDDTRIKLARMPFNLAITRPDFFPLPA